MEHSSLNSQYWSGYRVLVSAGWLQSLLLSPQWKSLSLQLMLAAVFACPPSNLLLLLCTCLCYSCCLLGRSCCLPVCLVLCLLCVNCCLQGLRCSELQPRIEMVVEHALHRNKAGLQAPPLYHTGWSVSNTQRHVVWPGQFHCRTHNVELYQNVGVE